MINKNLNFTFNHKDQRDKLYEDMTSTDIKRNFDSRAEEIKTYLYSIVDLLNTNGADNIAYDSSNSIKKKIDVIVNDLGTVTNEVTSARLGRSNLSALTTELDNEVTALQNTVGNTILQTVNKKVTSAINELKGTDDTLFTRYNNLTTEIGIGTHTLNTTSKVVIGAINELKAIIEGLHSHSNLTALNSIGEQDITSWDKAYADVSKLSQDFTSHITNHPSGGGVESHSHVNMVTLNSITPVKVDDWDKKPTRAEFNAVDLKTFELEEMILSEQVVRENEDTKLKTSFAEITQQQVTDLSLSGTTLKLKKSDGTTIGVGVTLPSGGEGHTHNNKTVLDGITQEKVTQWDNNSGSGSSYVNNDFSFNADVLLDITTFDGGNEAMHPKALYFEEGFGGFKFWLAYSPYTDWSELIETPCIACSNDGVNWETPNGVTNPLDKFDNVTTSFLSDPHLVYNSTTKYLEIWYREVVRNTSEKIWRRKSLDGKVWTEKELLITIDGNPTLNFVSPSVIYEENKYKIWGSKQTLQAKRVLVYYESTDGSNWTLIREIDLGRLYGEIGYMISHFDIIHTNVGYELIAQDTTDNLRYIIYMNSQDNITYGNFKLLMERRPTGYKYFDDDRMYRPCIMKVKEDYWCYYSASCTQPTGGSASDRDWKTGVLVFGKSILNADKVTKGIYDRKLNELKSAYKASKSLEISNQVNNRLAVNIRTISQFLYEDSSFVKENNCLYVVLDGNKAFKYFDYYYGQDTGGGTNPPGGDLTTENLILHYDVTKSTISTNQINDLTTNNNHGLLKNFSITPTIAGIVFSTNQHIELTNSIVFGESNFTIETFIKLPAQPDGNIFSKRYTSTNTLVFSISNTTTPTLTGRISGIEYNNTTGRSLVKYYSPLTTDTWVHLVLVKTLTEIQIWVNGVKVAYESTYGNYTVKLDETTSAKSYIGTSLGTGSFLKGTMKSFRIYNKALNQTEIENNYNYELG